MKSGKVNNKLFIFGASGFLGRSLSKNLTFGAETVKVGRNCDGVFFDLETSNRTVSDALKRRFFTQQEIQEGVFTDHPIWLWVIKEAVVKCIGTGIQSDLTKVVVRMAAADTLTRENWHIEWYPSTPRVEEMEYGFYASYATQELFEGKLYVTPYYVCAFAVPILNEGGNDG